jgi:hypothetical protein
MIINSDRKDCGREIIHIRGSGHRTPPFRLVTANRLIEQGSVCTRAGEINKILEGRLRDVA